MDQIKISKQDKQLASYLKALGHPVRLSIMRKLLEKSQCPHGSNPCCCGEKCEDENCKCGCKCSELVELFPISQSTVSQHIKELKTIGLIETRGRKGDYMINHSRLLEMINLLMETMGFESVKAGETKDCCCCQEEQEY